MESMFEAIKPFGRFQKLNTILLSTLSLISALHFYVQVFNMAEPKLECRETTPTTTNQSSSSLNEAANNNALEAKSVEKCAMWYNYSRAQQTSSSHSADYTPYTCEFRDPYYNLTAINSWGLVCERHALVFQSQTIFFVGSICIFLNGYVTDRLGRKRTCSYFLVFICVLNLIYQAFVVDDSAKLFGHVHLDWNVKFVLYCVYQFMAGFLVYSLYSSAYVMAVEFTSDDYHTLVANLILLAFVVGELILLLVFYVTRNWIQTNWFISACTLVSTICFIGLVPESPRWLAEMGRVKEAYEVLAHIAERNRVSGFRESFPYESMSKLMRHGGGVESGGGAALVKHKQIDDDQPDDLYNPTVDVQEEEGPRVIDLFWPAKNLIKLVVLFIIWNSINLNYSGVALGIISALDVNPFVMFLLSAIFEALGLLTCLANNRLGRKRALFTQLFLVSICSILISFLPDESQFVKATTLMYIKVGLALVGRGLISGSYNTIYIFASELYEVKVRSTAILLLSSGGCLSTLIAPQINMLRVFVWRPLPYIIFGASTLISSLSIFFLPETYHKHHHHQ